MAPKRATFMTYGDGDRCQEVKKYIEDAGIILDVRDIEKDPLTERELDRLLGYIPISHFLNPASPAFAKHKLDEGLPSREEMLKLIESEPTLLKRPIIRTTRLIMTGCDKKKIAEMLSIGSNGEVVEMRTHGNRKSGSRSMAAAGK